MPRELQVGHRPSSLPSIHPIPHGHCHRGNLTPGAVLRATLWPPADPQKVPLRAYSLTQYCPAVFSLSRGFVFPSVLAVPSVLCPVASLSHVFAAPQCPQCPVFTPQCPSCPHSVLTPHCVLAVPCSCCSHTTLTVQSSLSPESSLSKVSSVSP